VLHKRSFSQYLSHGIFLQGVDVHHVTFSVLTGLLAYTLFFFLRDPLYYGNVRLDTYVIYPVKIFGIFELYKSMSAYLKFHIPFLPRYLLDGHKLFGDETLEKLA